MAPTFRNAGAWSFTPNNVATPATLTPGAPASVAVGDLLLLVCESGSNTATVATPSGWSLATGFPKASGTAAGGTIYVFTRIADGTASDTPSPVWSGLTTGTTGTAAGAGILAWSGVQAVEDGTVTVSDLSGQTTTTTIPTLATGLPETLVVGVALKLLESSGQTSTVAGRTGRADNSTTSGTGHIIEVCDVVLAAPGTTAACTVTWSATTSARALAVSVGLAAVMPTPTDTGLTVTDSLAAVTLRPRNLSVTGLTVSDALATVRARTPNAVGLSLTDSLGKTAAKLVADTGATISDATALSVGRVAADTAVTVTDSIFASETGGGTNFPVFVFDRAIGPLPVVLVPLG